MKTSARTVTAAEMKEIERVAFERYGLTALILMENAGRSVAEAAAREFRLARGGVFVVCGTGNNGGDGFAAARHLANRGIAVTAALAGSEDRLGAETAFNLNAARCAGVRYFPDPDIRRIEGEARSASLVIDALFGTGLSRDLGEPHLSVVRAVNGARRILSIDVPSGMDSDSGKTRGASVRADLTVTLGLPKKGLAAAGVRFVTADISLPRALLKK